MTPTAPASPTATALADPPRAAAVGGVDCPHCGDPNGPGGRYCESCGLALPAAARVKMSVLSDDADPRTPPGRALQTRAQYGTARKAAWALLAVAALQLLTAAFFYFVVYPGVVRNGSPDDARGVLLAVATIAALGVVFLGLFAWALRSPLPAAIVGLVLFVTAILADAVADPRTLANGWLVRLIVIVVLAKAVQAGVRHRRLTRGDGPA